MVFPQSAKMAVQLNFEKIQFEALNRGDDPGLTQCEKSTKKRERKTQIQLF